MTNTFLKDLSNLKSSRQITAILKHEAAMFDRSSRYLVLVLTLGYREEFWQLTNIEQVRRDREHFFNNFRSNALLAEISGYVWKLEVGEQSGLHLHLVIYYDGAHRQDICIARSIGEYWVNVVTQGRGSYWNSNAQKNDYRHLPWGDATGQVNRNDYGKRSALQAYLSNYIAKPEQSVAPNDGRRVRTMGFGR